MKSFNLSILAFLFPVLLAAQVDSFLINQYTFSFITPEGWTLYSKDNGMCEYDETNVNLKMPLKNKKCFGALTISISEITAEERKRRNTPDTITDPLKLDKSTYQKEVADFMTIGGYYEARADNDTFYYLDSRGTLLTMKKMSTNKKMIEVHRYTRWCYYPVNDSLEILISFAGFIPHSEEPNADAAVSQAAWYFFYHNESQLDSLIKNTDPFGNEPEILPLDSISFLKSNLKFPLVPGWQYDTLRATDNATTTLLRMKTSAPDSCDIAAITMSYCFTESDPRSEQQEEWMERAAKVLPKSMKPEVYANGSLYAAKAPKQHYFFFQNSSETENPRCSELQVYTDSVHIFIYTKFNQRIKISISIQASSADPKTLTRYFHGYSRFLAEFMQANDFEKIYQINYEPE